MKWLWYVGPMVVLLVYLLSTSWLTDGERRWQRELSRWLEQYLGEPPSDDRSSAKDRKSKSRRVARLPIAFTALLERIGEGRRMLDAVLLPKLAYLSARGANFFSSSAHQTVFCRLEKAAPQMQVSPLPVIDGNPVENKGITFSKDPDFMEVFVVEGESPKGIGKWLTADIREILMEQPNVWLHTDGKVMALTLYGETDADGIDELVATADAIFAERGAGGGRALLGANEAIESHRERETPSFEPAETRERAFAGAIDLGLYLLAAFFVALVLGVFPWFHPAIFFNSADVVVTEAWTGGWTTKGFGAFVGAEALLVGLFAYQAYLGATHGESIGKRLFGLKVVRQDDSRVTFRTGLLQRSWALGALPLLVAAAQARPLSARKLFELLPNYTTVGVIALAVVLGTLPWLVGSSGRGAHDYLAGTKVVAASDGAALSPELRRKLALIGAVLVAYFLVYVAVLTFELGF